VHPVLSLGLGLLVFRRGQRGQVPGGQAGRHCYTGRRWQCPGQHGRGSGLHGDFDLAIVVAGVDRLYFGFGDRWIIWLLYRRARAGAVFT